LKSHSDTLESHRRAWGLRDFSVALALLVLALLVALASLGARLKGETDKGIAFLLVSLALILISATVIAHKLARRAHSGPWMLPFSFSITREGAVYIVTVLVLALAAINTGNNLLFLIISTLLSAIIASGIVSRASLKAISVSVQIPENVFEGERFSLKVSLRNQKRFFPAFSILVEDLALRRPFPALAGLRQFVFRRSATKTDETGNGSSVLRHAAFFPLVRAREKRIELVSQSFPKRGLYSLEGLRISTRFPFGFFKRSEHIRAQGKILVYPSIHELSGFFHLLPFLPGSIEGRRTGRGESLYAIRKYAPGDSSRLVDWKATAKTGELMAREYARDEESKFCIIFDTLIQLPLPVRYREEFEKAVTLAASLAAHFIEEGAEVEFLTPFEHVPRWGGTEQLYRILRSLAVVDCRQAQSESSADLYVELSGIVDADTLERILSDKLFKIIISSKPRGSFTSTVWRSSHVVYFDEL
jgi:uncharacterized protein (DUF58 family)